MQTLTSVCELAEKVQIVYQGKADSTCLLLHFAPATNGTGEVLYSNSPFLLNYLCEVFYVLSLPSAAVLPITQSIT